MLKGCPSDSLADHEAAAAALRTGDTKTALEILVDAWPETYVWLKNEIAEGADNREALAPAAMYMNPTTGSVDTMDGWSGQPDLDTLIQVKKGSGGGWVEVGAV